MKRLKSWSLSTYKSYKFCPRKVKFGKIDGIKEPGSEQMDRGSAIHKLAENYLLDLVKVLPIELAVLKKEFAFIKKKGAVAEEEWAFNTALDSCEWKHGWLRMKLDARYEKSKGTIVVIDFKTGHNGFTAQRYMADNKKHMSLYALGTFLKFPEAQCVEVELWYPDRTTEIVDKDSYNREEMPDLIEAWRNVSTPMMQDEIFPPRPGNHCAKCFYSKKKNGNCEFGG